MPIDNVMPDVMVVTMPLARIPEVAEVVAAIFDPSVTGSLKEPPPQRVIIANVLDHMACEGLLMNLDAIMNDTKKPDRAGGLQRVVADTMETAMGILRGRLGASALFVSPPGFMYWERNFQKFVYLLMEVCKARGMDFAICAPNLRVGAGDLPPAALSYLAYVAAISKVVQSVATYPRQHSPTLPYVAAISKVVQSSTIDDAIFYDHRMRSGRLTFDQQGSRPRNEGSYGHRAKSDSSPYLVGA